MKCPYCGKDIDMTSLDNIVDYMRVFRECECGTVINEQGEDVTEAYYKKPEESKT